ncbi:hypothetical protein BOTBODRAFT_396697 [Botryobasidium botryosum FD-172 SS1]|uniref:Uncharacterized protein n=1 Tax=Botryobasidium botryosum (strain FD-172 SS1) TaxID=930990 RepID=A0A067MC49_BOTB1|nr:hypothetical protein BOTBODRAFT_396697 [Botryobasidium botryosum FD-172 SS1]
MHGVESGWRPLASWYDARATHRQTMSYSLCSILDDRIVFRPLLSKTPTQSFSRLFLASTALRSLCLATAHRPPASVYNPRGGALGRPPILLSYRDVEIRTCLRHILDVPPELSLSHICLRASFSHVRVRRPRSLRPPQAPPRRPREEDRPLRPARRAHVGPDPRRAHPPQDQAVLSRPGGTPAHAPAADDLRSARRLDQARAQAAAVHPRGRADPDRSPSAPSPAHERSSP